MTREEREPQLVSVVIPAFNAADHLEGQLAALSLQDYAGPWEVVVADNGSTDSTVAVAQEWVDRLPGLRTVDASQLKGAAFARNVGAAAAHGDLLAFCDADDSVVTVWLSSLVSASASSDIVCGGFTADDAPRYFGFMSYASTGSMTVWRDVFEDVGGFDVRYQRGEDVDFSWRVQLSGCRLGFAADARIRRGERPTLRGSIQQAYHYGRWDVVLLRNYQSRGLETTVSARSRRRLWWLATRAPYLLMSRRRRLLWLRLAAHLLGTARSLLRAPVFLVRG